MAKSTKKTTRATKVDKTKPTVPAKVVAWPAVQDAAKARKAQAQLLASLKTKSEGAAAHLASEGLASDVKLWIPTGSTMLDMLLRGGIPVGRIVEIYGRESVGKTTIIAHAIANVQRLGGRACLIDSEASFYMERAKRIGVDVSGGFGLEVIPCPCVEFGFTQIYRLVPEFTAKFPGVPCLIVWDTIAAAPTETEYKAVLEGGAKHAGGLAEKARLLRFHMRVLANWLVEYNVALVMVNQVSEGMAKGGMPAADKSSGGLAIKFHSSARIEMKRGMEDPDYGQLAEARRKKCKVDGLETRDWKAKLYIGPDGINDRMSMLRFLIDECPKQTFVTKEKARVTFKLHGVEYKSYLKDVDTKVVPQVADFDELLTQAVREQFLTGTAAAPDVDSVAPNADADEAVEGE